jgi:ABC-2 type transport system ATP-binding protein
VTLPTALDLPAPAALRPAAPADRPAGPPAAAAAALQDAAEPALQLRRVVVPLPDEPLRVSDWRIQPGEKVAVIGRNGAGKTSLTEAILGLRSGAVAEGRMLGADLRQWHRQPRLRKQLGVQLQRVFFPGRPRVSELVALHRALYDRTSAKVIDALGIDALSRRLYEFLSRGETQRVDLFLALAHEPRMLFLDEPFTGLDPQFARKLGQLLRELRDTTLVMCCHTVEELDLTTHTAWLSRRGIVRHAATQDLRRELVGEFRLTAHCTDAAAALQLARELQERGALERSPVVEASHFGLASSRQLSDVARALVDHPAVLSVDVGHSQLADLLRHCSRDH